MRPLELGIGRLKLKIIDRLVKECGNGSLYLGA
jgi:hypothetical protein